jgi:hypothetical protein
LELPLLMSCGIEDCSPPNSVALIVEVRHVLVSLLDLTATLCSFFSGVFRYDIPDLFGDDPK